MNLIPTKSLASSLALAALCAGCAGTGPNTQRGAVGGAALGAVAGGIIGNNHGSHNTWSGAAIGAAAGGLAGAALGNATDQQQGTVYGRSQYDTAPRQPIAATPAPQQPVQYVQAAPQPPVQYVEAAPTVQYSYSQPTEYVVEAPPSYPPPVREVVTVRPAREAVWIHGYYAFNGHRGNAYQWVPGHWEIPPPRYHTFVEPRWERRGGNYIYVSGYWR